ncbi:MAG TPA: DUF4129 domain-containing protein [Verrucomicrobium sp.]|nr:DUF4129 domain-containing protein [Verrucomicrobium sp.]
MPAPKQAANQPLISLLEEATHLLRRSSSMAWLTYYVSTLPFVLFLFFFLNDMARSANASRHVVESSLILGLLYGVMKVGQALHCDLLMALVEGRAKSDAIPFRGKLRLIASQILIHATAPWILVFSLIALVPLPWTYAFYHNVTVLAVDHFRRGGTTRGLVRIAAAQSHHEWMQNSAVIGVFKLIALLVYLNLFAAFALTASLLKSFTGVENVFSMNWMLYLGSTVQGFLFLMCYLGLNPFVKSIYVLRCFYGESRTTGTDLAVRLRWVTAASAGTRLAIVLLVALFWTALPSPQLQAQAEAPSAPVVAVDSTPEARDQQLAQNITEVLQGTEYQWRMPRDGENAAAKDESSWLTAGIKDIGAMVSKLMDQIGNTIGDLIDWIFGRRGDPSQISLKSPGSAWMAMMPKFVMVLVVLLVVGVAWLLYRNWRESRTSKVAEALDVPPEINLESEHVVASQLPENEWLRLAREKMDAGELRLALRALFLATLAHLGEKHILMISRTKSNGDYVREIARRARGHEGLHASFVQQVRTFDRVWYGWHEVSPDLMNHFQQEHERITRHAA